MRLLLSAYACEPGKGSEPEVGYRALLAAAEQHEVWVLTRENNLPALGNVLAGHPHRDRIHLVGLDVSGPLMRLKRRGQTGIHIYYDAWQRRAASRAIELDREVNFDLVHHVTFATYWTRVGVAVLHKPLVWGPVGGGVETPMRLVSELGARGFAEEIGRTVFRRVIPHISGARGVVRSSHVALAQNHATATRLKAPTTIILPNATCIALDEHFLVEPRVRGTDVVFAGRLIPWKGAKLAVRVMRYIRHPEARLFVYGEGPDRPRVERAVEKWGLSHRVVLAGRVPRDELLSHLRRCRALLHPSFHDESPLIMAEALSLGTPVVSLDHGGPPELVQRWPTSPSLLVKPGTPRTSARRLANALDRFLADPEEPRREIVRPEPSFERALLSIYDDAVNGRSNQFLHRWVPTNGRDTHGDKPLP